MAVAIESCLAQNQSGLSAPAALETGEQMTTLISQAQLLGLDLSQERGEDGVMVPTLALPPDTSPLLGRTEATTQIAAPRFSRIMQGRACSRQKRTPNDINYIVWHTPEGSEAGTLSVLNGTGASYDIFVPMNGNVYKTNDWWNFVAWQAGDWPYNLAGIGIEQGDYAARSGGWDEKFYQKLAQVCAWMGEVCSVPVRNGARGVPGFIDHAEITPGRRTDPGAGFRRELMLSLISDYMGGRGPTPWQPPKPVAAQRIYFLYEQGTLAEKFAKAATTALQAAGVKYTDGKAYEKVVALPQGDADWASYKALKGQLGQYPCTISGTQVVDNLHPDARGSLRDASGKWYPPDESDLWDGVTDMHRKHRWRIAEICEREKADATKAFAVYEDYLTKAA